MFFIFIISFLCFFFVDYFLTIIGLILIIGFCLSKVCGGGGYSLFQVDFLSLSLVVIRFLVVIFMRYSSIFLFHIRILNLFYNIILLIIIFRLILVFFLRKIILFYIFFEISLIPIFLLVAGWGSNYEKLQSSVYMFMYTLMGSLPLLVYIGIFTKNLGVYNFFFIFQFFRD